MKKRIIAKRNNLSFIMTWTQQAIDCYNLDTNCFNCPIYNQYHMYDCKMFEVVKLLLNSIGEPPKDLYKAIEEKTCPKCKETKPIECFTHSSRSKDGYSTYCRECTAEINRNYRKRKHK